MIIFIKIHINNNMNIKIKDNDITLHYSVRMYIIFENITGGSLDFSNLTSYTNIINLLYSVIIGTLQYNKKQLIEYGEFLDWLDEQDTNKVLAEFGQWLADNMKIQSDLSPASDNDSKDEKEDVKKN